jgi:hypothetical protein
MILMGDPVAFEVLADVAVDEPAAMLEPALELLAPPLLQAASATQSAIAHPV